MPVVCHGSQQNSRRRVDNLVLSGILTTRDPRRYFIHLCVGAHRRSLTLGPSLLAPAAAAKCSHTFVAFHYVCAPRLFWFECTGMRAVCFFPKRLTRDGRTQRRSPSIGPRVLLNFASRKPERHTHLLSLPGDRSTMQIFSRIIALWAGNRFTFLIYYLLFDKPKITQKINRKYFMY